MWASFLPGDASQVIVRKVGPASLIWNVCSGSGGHLGTCTLRRTMALCAAWTQHKASLSCWQCGRTQNSLHSTAQLMAIPCCWAIRTGMWKLWTPEIPARAPASTSMTARSTHCMCAALLPCTRACTHVILPGLLLLKNASCMAMLRRFLLWQSKYMKAYK